MPVSREFVRKAVHLLGTSIPIAYLFLDREIMLVALTVAALITIGMEYARLWHGINLVPDILRKDEERRIAAYACFAIASLLAIFFFEKRIAIAALLMLCIGDSVVGIIGAVLPLQKSSRIKDVRLMVMMLGTCFLVGVLFVSPPIAFVGAVGAMVADAFPWRFGSITLDDNLTIPLLAGFLMTVVSPL